jgi:hypothetical protein
LVDGARGLERIGQWLIRRGNGLSRSGPGGPVTYRDEAGVDDVASAYGAVVRFQRRTPGLSLLVVEE